MRFPVLMAEFKDHFSTQSASYAKYRPTYPEPLFDYLAGLCPVRGHAWDCATGNGQAARGLAKHFDSVSASDASPVQISNAAPHERIRFFTAPAETSGLRSASVDLVTVAQALHWFDLEAFFTEVDRVLKPGGILAVWCYMLCRVEKTPDEVITRFYEDITGPFWPPERDIVERGYADIPFPFAEVDPPKFTIEATWSVEDMLGYMGSWSATQRYKDANDADPLSLVDGPLRRAWGEGRNRKVRWPMALRVGRKPTHET